MSIYADTAAATPISDRVRRAMEPYEQAMFYNPSSLYPMARKAKEAVERARTDIARLLSVQSHTIVFTSGGTESAHLAILGTLSRYEQEHDNIPHIVASSFEHPAVDELLRTLHIEGRIALTLVPPRENGIVAVQDMLEVVQEGTVLVCLMVVNNEIGTIQPVRALSSEIKRRREKNPSVYPYIYSDAAQAPQAIGINRDQLGADLISFDGAKLYGPKGIGCLYVASSVALTPIQHGGGQERGLRAGTEAVPLIVGMAEAMKETVEMQPDQVEYHREIQAYFVQKLDELMSENKNVEYEINGSMDRDERIPQNINICFKKSGQPINSEFLTIQLGERGIMVSPGASCGSNKTESVSQTIEALGKPACASSSLRFTFARTVDESEIDTIVKVLKEVI